MKHGFHNSSWAVESALGFENELASVVRMLALKRLMVI